MRAAERERGAWIEERTGCHLMPDARLIEAVDTGGRTRGMVAYERWTPNSVQAHMAVDSPIVCRSLIDAAFSYPFEECGKGVLLAFIREDNHKSTRMTQHIGFVETHRIRDGWEVGVDLVAFEMRKESCPWLGPHQKAALHG